MPMICHKKNVNFKKFNSTFNKTYALQKTISTI